MPVAAVLRAAVRVRRGCCGGRTEPERRCLPSRRHFCDIDPGSLAFTAEHETHESEERSPHHAGQCRKVEILQVSGVQRGEPTDCQ